jgi:hydroxymethylpyrimidine pyrophosphatase-like HAD family hydrolase
VPLLVATGRRVASTRAPLAAVGLAPPAVVLNGALGLDLRTGERFHRAPFDTADAVAAVGALASVGLQPVVYVDHPRWDAFLGAQPSTNPRHVQQLGDTVTTDDLARVAAEEAVLGFGMIGVPFADAEAARDAIGDLAEVHLDHAFDYTGLASLTIAPRGQSKWDGVQAFCRAEGLDSGRVLAVADGPNDLELLDHAALRAVPAVAHPAALERADHVLPPASDGGWAEVLDLIA